MPRRARKTRFSPASLGWLALAALGLFGLAETYRFTRSESGQLALGRSLGLGDAAHLTRIVGNRLRAAITAAEIPADSIRERLIEGHEPAAVWTVPIRPGTSLIQLNHTVTRALEASGVAPLRAQESWTDGGAPMLTLVAGLPRRATHEVHFVVRATPTGEAGGIETARLSVVLFGLGENPAAADSVFDLEAPFAVAIVPGHPTSRGLFRAARARGREVVLHLPLEPINYPRLNPGPGTLLVTMKPSRIATEVRKFMDQAHPAAAVANHMGSLATQDMLVMRAVFRELRRERLPFIHVTPAAGAVCRSLASEMGVPYFEPDAVLDQEFRPGQGKGLERRWKDLLRRARTRGRLVVWVRVTPASRAWVVRALNPKKLEGVSIVPLTAMVRPASPI